jgi:hypothetical protein
MSRPLPKLPKYPRYLLRAERLPGAGAFSDFAAAQVDP